MRGEQLAQNQLLMAQAIGALADHIDQATGYQLTPLLFGSLPAPAAVGMLACVSDSTVSTWGSVIAGGGGFKVLAFFDGVHWVVK
jgi:hypothetical protein